VVPAASATMGMGDVKFLEGDVANIIVSIIHKNLKPEDVRAVVGDGVGEGGVSLRQGLLADLGYGRDFLVQCGYAQRSHSWIAGICLTQERREGGGVTILG
jgi:hypothetical protein